MTRALFLSLSLMTAISSSPAEAQQEPGHFSTTVTRELHYLVSLPADYDADGNAVPLLLFLHGAGERGDDLEKLKVHGPPRMIEAGHDFPAIVVSPQCPADSWWTREIESLTGLLDDIEARYNVDKTRIYVTGLSMGGYGTWHLATRHPERFAAIIPICGGGERWGGRPLGEAGLPIWAFHGDHDFVVPVSESLEMVNSVNRQKSGRARLTVFPDTDHNSWDAAYDDPETWTWLFSHRLNESDASGSE